MAQTISNQARVSFSYEGSDVTYTNDSNVVNSTMREKYDFLLEKTATADCFRPSDRITFFVHITNTGCGCLGLFRVSDTLGGEDYMTYVDGSARLFVGGSMTEITPTNVSPLEFEISSDLARDAELILQYTAEVDSDINAEVTEIVNEVSVEACPCVCGCDTSSSSSMRCCITKTTSLTIEKCEFADVLITKAVSNDNVCCDEEVDYIITLTNIGSVDATNVVVTDTLPANFTLLEIHSENNGVHYKYDASEFDLDDANLLTLPNATGTAIYVPAIAPGVDNTIRIRIHGHM